MIKQISSSDATQYSDAALNYLKTFYSSKISYEAVVDII
jgi:hypothetical protein